MGASYFLVGSNLEKCGHFLEEKLQFFQADMARLGKYSTGGYGRIGVYDYVGLEVLVEGPQVIMFN